MVQGSEHFKQVQQQVSSALKQGVKRVRSKMNSLQAQMGSTEKCEEIQKQADLVTANIYRCNLPCPAALALLPLPCCPCPALSALPCHALLPPSSS